MTGTCLNAFEMWCWNRMLCIPWTTTRKNVSILKEFPRLHNLKNKYKKTLLWSYYCEKWGESREVSLKMIRSNQRTDRITHKHCDNLDTVKSGGDSSTGCQITRNDWHKTVKGDDQYRPTELCYLNCHLHNYSIEFRSEKTATTNV